MIVLVPSYEPTDRLVEVVDGLHSAAPGMTVLVVDDGSGPNYDMVFERAERAGATVIRYDVNRGKGHALKTGIRYVLENFSGESVVTADSDGQHTTVDILRVAERLRGGDGELVLGGRRFAGDVPVRSRFGNAVSRQAFRLATGVRVHDTQSGLRGLPADSLDWLLEVKGERFEYELNMLLDSPDAGQSIDEIEIETVYLEQNASSHFRPIVDSVRVMRPLLAYGAASFGSFLIDIVALQLLYLLTGSLLVSVVGARLVSGSINFLLNRHVVFRSAGPRRREALAYLSLAVVMLAASYGFLDVFTKANIPILPAKLITDTALYVIGFQIQRRVVFARAAPGVTRSPSDSPAARRGRRAPAAAA